MEFDKTKAPSEVKNDPTVRQSRATGLSAAKSRMSSLVADEANRMAYMDMKTAYYLLGTLGFYAVILGGSIIIPSAATIFDFASAFCVSAQAFGFPALFYFRASKRFGGGTVYYTRMAYLYAVIACCNVVIGTTSCLLNIIIGGEAGGE